MFQWWSNLQGLLTTEGVHRYITSEYVTFLNQDLWLAPEHTCRAPTNDWDVSVPLPTYHPCQLCTKFAQWSPKITVYQQENEACSIILAFDEAHTNAEQKGPYGE